MATPKGKLPKNQLKNKTVYSRPITPTYMRPKTTIDRLVWQPKRPNDKSWY